MVIKVFFFQIRSHRFNEITTADAEGDSMATREMIQFNERKYCRCKTMEEKSLSNQLL